MRLASDSSTIASPEWHALLTEEERDEWRDWFDSVGIDVLSAIAVQFGEGVALVEEVDVESLDPWGAADETAHSELRSVQLCGLPPMELLRTWRDRLAEVES